MLASLVTDAHPQAMASFVTMSRHKKLLTFYEHCTLDEKLTDLTLLTNQWILNSKLRKLFWRREIKKLRQGWLKNEYEFEFEFDVCSGGGRSLCSFCFWYQNTSTNIILKNSSQYFGKSYPLSINDDQLSFYPSSLPSYQIFIFIVECGLTQY